MTPSEIVNNALTSAIVDYDKLYQQLLEEIRYKPVHETQKRLCEEFSTQQRLIAQQQTATLSQIDPDGPHVPLPKKPLPVRTITSPSHDFVAALYRPYEAVL